MPDRFRFRNAMPTSGIRASVLVPEISDGVAKMRLYDPIDDWGGDWGVSAKEFASALAALPAEVHTIHLHINSPGGMVFEGVAILNQLRQHSAKVVAVVDGLAASAASFIACGADEVQMSPNTQLMIHDAWGLAIGNAATMRDAGDLLDRLSDNIASVYASKTGGTTAEWRTAMLAESWYSAEEAVAAGLADSIVGETSDDQAVKDAAASFDLSTFKFGGRDEAPEPLITNKGGIAAGLQSERKRVADKYHRLG